MRKKRLLIIGCGDIALRAVRFMHGRYRLYGLTRDSQKARELRVLGITPIIGDLDNSATLGRLSGLAELILHTAPPPATSLQDRRTANLLNALGKGRMVPQRLLFHRACRLVYISTSGVYGNCAGELVPETRRLSPQTARATRRVDAERQLRSWGRRCQARVSLLRAPGIYAVERLPLQRLRAATPALRADEDSYSNHIHADDLARIAVLAFSRGRPGRSYNASDNSQLKMGEYFDLLADHFGLPRPPRISRLEAEETLPATLLSFMAESRRLVNDRLRKELRVFLRYPTVRDAVDEFIGTTRA